jgi:hypothetical protein
MRIASFDVGIKNLAVCVLDDELVIQDWKVMSLSRDGSKMSLQELADAMYVTLETCLASWGHVDVVLIENQPVMKNPMMKTVQMLIYGFFQGARIACRVGEILLMSARNKLRVSKAVQVTHLKTRYGNTKQSSVQTALVYLQGKDEMMARFQESRKKDDLSDCFLQAVYYVERCA